MTAKQKKFAIWAIGLLVAYLIGRFYPIGQDQMKFWIVFIGFYLWVTHDQFAELKRRVENGERDLLHLWQKVEDYQTERTTDAPPNREAFVSDDDYRAALTEYQAEKRLAEERVRRGE